MVLYVEPKNGRRCLRECDSFERESPKHESGVNVASDILCYVEEFTLTRNCFVLEGIWCYESPNENM